MLWKQTTALLLTGSMVVRLGMLVLAAGLILAGVAAPARAESAATAAHGDGETIHEQFAIRQAYLGWLAAKEEAGMDATIRYISRIGGDPTGMTRIRDQFGATADRMQGLNHDSDLDTALQDCRNLTGQFRDATRAEMEAAGGSETDLASSLTNATSTDRRVHTAQDQYWRIRMAAEPSSFDRYIRESGATLSVLREHGYDTAGAQADLDRIESLRGGFLAALQAEDYGAAESIREKIDETAAHFEFTIQGIQTAGITATRSSQPDTS